MSDKNVFDVSQREALDKMIKERMGQGSLVADMEREEDKKLKVNESSLLSWSDDFHKYPYLYIILCVSALFTMTLGLFMGIAPKLDLAQGVIVFQTDPMHIFLALVYMVAFVTVTEGAFVIAKLLYHTRENGNRTQTRTMLAMMLIAGFSIVGTGISGGMVVASNIAFLSAFIEIPESAQRWVIIIIPILLAIYAFLLTAYALSSAAAKSERMLWSSKRTSELDHQTRSRAIQQIADEQLQAAELSRFLELVQSGKISAAEAKAAIRAGRTLGQEEKRQGRDIDGDGRVGQSQSRPMPAANLQMAASTPAAELAEREPSPNGSHPNSQAGR